MSLSREPSEDAVLHYLRLAEEFSARAETPEFTRLKLRLLHDVASSWATFAEANAKNGEAPKA
jgi:hypothetical protein